jgi:hypothetical protein
MSKMKTGRLVLVLAVFSAAALLIWAYRMGKEARRLEAQGEETIAPAAGIQKGPHGEIFVELSPAAVELADIRTEVLKPLGAGFLLPRSAVLRQDGTAWTYTEAAPGRYERKEIRPIELAGPGWIVRRISPQNRVVTQGAQLLLSEELKSNIRVGG